MITYKLIRIYNIKTEYKHMTFNITDLNYEEISSYKNYPKDYEIQKDFIFNGLFKKNDVYVIASFEDSYYKECVSSVFNDGNKIIITKCSERSFEYECCEIALR